MYRTLDANKLLDTAETLSQRIEERFPGAGLGEVAREANATMRDSAARAVTIAQPNIPLRIALFTMLGLVIMTGVLSLFSGDVGVALGKVWGALDGTRGAAFSIAIIVFFFWTLETRFKRRKALKALHEVRSLVHVIDMHQLAKNPEQVVDGTVEIGGRPMDAESMARYLEFCAELLSVVSKVGHLYVQDFPDATSLNAADQVESLAAGLSNKIYQKIMILQRIRTEQETPVSLPQKG